MRSIAGLVTKSLGIVLLGWAVITVAQEWPKQRPITFVVAFPSGSITDTLARLIAPKVAESIGQVVVVDNRPGAGGNIAAQRVQRTAGDGYTILVTSNALVVNASLYASAGYDPIAGFAPVILTGSTPSVVCVHPSVPAKNLRELVELARTRPLAYASAPIGTTGHLSMERFKTAAKVSSTHVPYQPAQAVTAAISGETQVSNIALTLVLPHIKAGKLRPIAVTSAQRSSALPDVPTVNEQGFGGFDDLAWFGFFAPAGTPTEIRSRLNSEINRALELPDLKERLGHLGLDFRRNSPAEFATFIREEVPKWARAVKDSGAKVE
ncbi:MAG TPA: tripartite tricarboxylate transporter substrate binding protein [Burkholderiales bacterium]|nr:tripartite tricarboxylate transporter substrate binding protein [Burkholderiales bacterium]